MANGFTSIPDEIDGQLGRDKSDLTAVPDLDHYVPAQEWNTLKAAVATAIKRIGLADGSQSDTIENELNSASGITVREQDSSPSVSGVTEIRVANGTLTDEGGGAVSIATGGGGGGGGYLVGSSNDTVTDLGSEVALGGFVMDGSSGTLTFRFYGKITSSTADADLLLYDLGAPGSPVSGVLRSTINLSALNNPATATQALTPDAAPGTDADEVFNTARMYELRLLVNSGTAGDEVKVYWGGVEVS